MKTTAPGNVVSTAQYNIRGHKTTMSDPDMGQWMYTHNALGELVYQRDAKGQEVTMVHDLLGRLVARFESEGATVWQYDTRWKGTLTQVTGPGYEREYTYTAFGAVKDEIHRIDADAVDPSFPPVVISSFTANPSTFQAGQSTTLSWSTSDAASCRALGNLPGWTGNKAVNGSQNVTVNSAGQYQATLECTGASGDTATRQVAVTVESGGPPPDPNPDPFGFDTQINVPTSQWIVSNPIVPEGYNVSTTVSAGSGTQYSLSCSQNNWTSAQGSILPGTSICVRHESASSPNTLRRTALQIGTTVGYFDTRTAPDDGPSDTDPDPFGFDTQTGVPINAWVVSNAVVPTGYNVTTTVKAGTGTQYSLDCSQSNWTSSEGTIAPGQSICVRHLSASSPNTLRKTALLIGNTIGYFTTRTEIPPLVVVDSFKAEPDELSAGQSTTLSWTSSNGVSCRALGDLPGWTGSKALNGSRTLKIDTRGQYQATLECTGAGGDTASRSVNVTVKTYCVTSLLQPVCDALDLPPQDIDPIEPALPDPEDPDVVASVPYVPPLTILAPPYDLAGSFTVKWGEPLPNCNGGSPPLLCPFGNVRYVLEIATERSFADGVPVFEGPQQEFGVKGLAPGVYYFRVHATYEYCPSSLCIEQTGWEEKTDTYGGGSNSTIVASELCHLIPEACEPAPDPPTVPDDPLGPPVDTVCEKWPDVCRSLPDPSPSSMTPTGGDQAGTMASSQSGPGTNFKTYVYTYHYDTQGRLRQTDYPGGAGFKLEQVYNDFGALERVRHLSTGTVYWRAERWNEWGGVEEAALGNGLTTRRYQAPDVGHLQSILTGPSGSGSVQTLNYDWDKVGNLKWREDARPGQTALREEFAYDTLNRLRIVQLYGAPGVPGGTVTMNVTYNALGNITSKTGMGSYSYGGPRPHAVIGAGGRTYAYDANGNMTQGAGRSYAWTSYNLPNRIERDGVRSEFLYGDARQRLRQDAFGADGHRRIYYAGLYEEHHRGISVERKFHVPTPDGVIAIETHVGFDVTTHYLHRDHLGSVDVITNASGTVIQRLSYDAFGKRRAADWTGGAAGGAAAFLTARGFTGHEHLDDLGLIHMNGRVFDPTLGRFISADPFIQFPYHTQSHNRYSYLLNNPLNATDPSGFFLKKAWRWVEKNWRTIAAVVITVVTCVYAACAGAAAAGGLTGAQVAMVAAGGFAAGMVASGGDWRAGLIGAWTAVAFAGVGQAFSGATWAQPSQMIGKVVTHGVVGGASSVMQGGKFGHGFLSAGASAALAPEIHGAAGRMGAGAAGQVVAASIVGGTASALGGGKFANGAVTGAMSYAFNQCLSRGCGAKLNSADMKAIAEEAERLRRVFDANGVSGLLRENPHLAGLSDHQLIHALDFAKLDVNHIAMMARSQQGVEIARHFSMPGVPEPGGPLHLRLAVVLSNFAGSVSSIMGLHWTSPTGPVAIPCGGQGCDVWVGAYQAKVYGK